MSDATWHTLLQHIFVEYVTLLTYPEGPAPSAPSMTSKEVIGRDTARKDSEASASSIATAAAATNGSNSGWDGACVGGGGANVDDANAAGDDANTAEEVVSILPQSFQLHNCHGGTWNKTLLITHTRVQIK